MNSSPRRAGRMMPAMISATLPGRVVSWLCLVTVALCLGACDGEPPSAEAQLRALLAAGEAEVEARDLSAVMERIDPAYRDNHQRDWRQLRALLAGYFFRHPSIFVLSRIDSIEIEQPDRARVVLIAGLAGSAQEAAGPLEGWRGNLLRLDLEFKQHEGDWRLIQADWRQARREDFTP